MYMSIYIQTYIHIYIYTCIQYTSLRTCSWLAKRNETRLQHTPTMPMNSKWWKTILIERILSGATWVVATFVCWPVDWRKATWKLMKTYLLIHSYTYMESKHADANHVQFVSARVVSCHSEGAIGVWLIWLITADLIWSEARWNRKMKQSYDKHW